MAINKIYVTVEVEVAWWFRMIYVPLFITIGLFILNNIDPNFKPNYARMNYWLAKAIKVS